MSDNPFAEPEDDDRTIIRPGPNARSPLGTGAGVPVQGLARGGAPPRAAARSAASPAATASPGVTEGSDNLGFGAGPLAAAAAPLLALMARLGNTASMPDSGDLRERTVQEVRRFERAAREAGVEAELLRPAHYALCASLDDVVLNTPWGSDGRWSTGSLASTFHQEVRSGERFFDLLGRMNAAPGRFLPVIELMYVCMSLGFVGRFRLSPRGTGELERLREETYAVIARQHQARESALSPHAEGLDAPYRASRAIVPVWMAAVVVLSLAALAFVYALNGLNGASDLLYERLLAAPPSHMPVITREARVAPPPPPASATPSEAERLRGFLAPEIAQGLVAVVGTPGAPVIRLSNRGMFLSGQAVVQPGFRPLLARIGEALASEKGKVTVIGYTDNQPIRTVAFPSNFALSSARARAAGSLVAASLGRGARLATEGRADAEPVASNAGAEGREQNRRIEVVLDRTEG